MVGGPFGVQVQKRRNVVPHNRRVKDELVRGVPAEGPEVWVPAVHTNLLAFIPRGAIDTVGLLRAGVARMSQEPSITVHVGS